MVCPRCRSENVIVQAVAHVKTKRHGILYWIFIGWWLEPLLWLFLTLPMLIIRLFGSKKVTTKVKSHAVCQTCGYNFVVR